MKNMKTIGIGAAIVVVIVIVAMMLLGGESNNQPAALDVEDFTTVSFSTSENAEFLRILRSLQGVDLDGSLFTRQAFISLVDFSVPISEQPRGIVNPFLPVGMSPALIDVNNNPDPVTIPTTPANNPVSTSTNQTSTTTPADTGSGDSGTSTEPLLP